ncbi:MAG: glycosyl hydrolase [Acidobacteriota bacterium]|nr:glycosyl hydrolase [Acidobacteriota bacterium]
MSKTHVLFPQKFLLVFIFLFASASLINAQVATPTPLFAPTPQTSPSVTPTPAPKSSDPLKNLQYRLIGPFRGGRVGAVAGVPSQPNVYYFGATGGGIWKTTDGGTNWENVSDGFFKTGSVGAVAVSESDPNVIYVGMGEETVRGNVSHGDGVYKSTDSGKTWKFVGLGDTRQISRVRINPKNPDIVYVAALGHLWANNEQRGIFRSKDGGKTWEKILYRNAETGAEDLTFDPNNANTLYASFWQIKRTPWSMDSGGAGSSIYKSTDGGDTWTEITRNKGLPTGILGKICVTVSPVNSQRIWAMVEAKEGGLYRSDDGGDNWQKMSDSPNIKQRPWYFSRVYADTQNADTMYVMNVGVWKSIDGGRNFVSVPTPHGDNHDWWIAPNDNQRMIGGDDGGAHVTMNGGKTWTEQDQPTAQFYRVVLDNDFPYNIYGAQQDNSTVRIASRTNDFAITERDWYDVGGGESGWIAPLPTDSNVVFAGSYGGYLTRQDHRTGQQKDVNVYPENPMGAGADVQKYRFQWSYPILFSPHKTNGVYPLYAAGNVLFRSLDEGNSWQPISPDLTRNDKSKQASSGGPISQDNTSIEYYDTIFTVAESPVTQGVIWSGSDDGLVQVTRDNGKTWENVTPKDMPEWIQINAIDASPFDAGTAYVAATAYKSDNYKPYLFKTSDYGKTWKKIVSGIPNDAFTRVVREDPNRRGFLFAGTETGIYYSTNDGEIWQPIQLNLPIVPVTDLAFHKRDKDLVVATQGRAFYVLDNLPVLYNLADAQRADAYLFKPEDAYRQAGGGGFPLPKTATIGANPPNGAIIDYYLKTKLQKELTLEFLDATGKTIRKFTGKPQTEGAPQQQQRGEEPNLPTDTGLNQFVWNYRLPSATNVPGLILWGGTLAGARVAPGNYQVRLTVDGKAVSTESFTVKADPRMTTTQEDFQKQFDLMSKINAKLTETHDAILEIRDTRKQLEDLSARLKAPEQKDLRDRAAEISKKLTAVEEELNQTKIKSGQDALNFPIKLNNKLAALASAVDSSDSAPTAQSYDVYNDLTAKIDAQLAKLTAIKSNDIAAFNKSYAEKNLPVIVPKSK